MDVIRPPFRDPFFQFEWSKETCRRGLTGKLQPLIGRQSYGPRLFVDTMLPPL
jgi:hypothetical protein